MNELKNKTRWFKKTQSIEIVNVHIKDAIPKCSQELEFFNNLFILYLDHNPPPSSSTSHALINPFHYVPLPSQGRGKALGFLILEHQVPWGLTISLQLRPNQVLQIGEEHSMAGIRIRDSFPTSASRSKKDYSEINPCINSLGESVQNIHWGNKHH